MAEQRQQYSRADTGGRGKIQDKDQNQQHFRPPASSPRHARQQFSSPTAQSPPGRNLNDSTSLDDLDIEIDYQAVEQTIRSEETPGKRDLDTVLPKLAKRIQKTQDEAQTKATSEDEKEPSTPVTSNINNKSSQNMNEPPAPLKRRVSVTRSGSVTFQPSANLPPEIEQLRCKDIEPDENSAADQALKAAANLAAAASAGARRESMAHASQQDHQEVEGREIQQDHAQYALTYGMMLGIRVTTGRRDIDLDLLSTSKSLSAILEEQELTTHDYNFTTELVFKPEGNSTPPFPTPPHKLNFTFTFKDYMTNVFRAVRALSNIEEADYMLSLAGDFNYIEFIANSKSGQFFFYSHDGKYMIKTQSKEESKLLRRIMPLYIQHLTRHPDSLLVRFYGMHRVKMKSLRSKTYFVIMSSVFNTPKPIAIKYDLKGSTVGRLTSPEDCRAGAVQKDLNLMESGNKVRLGEPNIDIFHETLKADVTFLKELHIMDYSLLLGIHHSNPNSPNNRRSAAMRRRSSGVVLSSRSSVRLQSPSSPPDYAEKTTEEPSSSHQPFTQRGGGDGRASFLDRFPEGEEGGGGASLFTSQYGGIRSADSSEIYFMGIIDILQVYNTGKQMENFFKGFTHDRKQLSAVDPNLYADRMLNFIMQHTDYPDIMERRKIAQKAGKVNVNALNRANSRQRLQQQANTAAAKK